MRFRGYGWIPTLTGDIFLNNVGIIASNFVEYNNPDEIQTNEYDVLKTKYHVVSRVQPIVPPNPIVPTTAIFRLHSK